MMAQCEAASLGLGLVLAPPYAIHENSGLVPVLQDSFHAERSFWLAAPVDLYRLQRVRVVWNLLREYSGQHPPLFAHTGG
jgi:DNA-binding transcriptional LysR family regulator